MMKKVTLFNAWRRVLFAMLAPFVALSVGAAVGDMFDVDGITYRVLSEESVYPIGTVSVADAKSATGVVVIPESLVNEGVTYLVTEIGISAFEGSSVTSITIPKGVTSILRRAFALCESLETLIYNAAECTFKGTGRTTLPFYGTSNISRVIFGDEVRVIPEGLFYGVAQNQITEVTIPRNVVNIQSDAFRYCPNLEKVTFYCTSLSSADFSGTKWHNNLQGIVYIGTYLYGIFGTVEGEVVIPDGVTYFPDLSAQSQITSLVVPPSIKEISVTNIQGMNALGRLELQSPTMVTLSGDATTFMKQLNASECQLVVPDNLSGAYATEMPWCLLGQQPNEYNTLQAELYNTWGEVTTISIVNGMQVSKTDMTISNVLTGEEYYQLDHYVKIRFINNGYDKVDAAAVTHDAPVIEFAPDGITIKGIAHPTDIAVYTVDARKCFFAPQCAGSCLIPRAALPKGLVIIKAGDTSIKITNK